MKKLTLFYLEDCPYCHYARRAVKELAEERAEYRDIDIEWIDESRHPEISQNYDYYYVPSIFEGKNKLYEADPSEKYSDCKTNIKSAFDVVIKGE